jgi:Acyl-protein synthetase, LuxE
VTHPAPDEVRGLDARIVAAIGDYALSDAEFLALARDLFAYQIAHNEPYAAFARARGFGATRLPAGVEEIPAVPAAAFKEARLATFPPSETAVWFETSGTTRGRGGRHELPTTRLYEAALLASFDRMMLPDVLGHAQTGARLRYLNLVPDPRENPHSSLGFMMATVARERGDGADGWYLRGDALDVDGFVRDVARARADGVAVCVATTAFALVALNDALAERGVSLALPDGSRIMETGGFKGRTRVVERAVLYAETSARLGVPVEAIVAEYGMTELSSQYYDAFASRGRVEPRVKVAPPWLRPIVVDGEGRPLPRGVVGAIRHVDLANRGSVVAIETEDLGALVEAPGSDEAGAASGARPGLVLLGREQGAELRGCSLDAESLLARRD